jgi:hypothetical protein
MSLPTAAEVTSLFLYGTTVPPQDKTDPNIPLHQAPPALQIDRTDFMTNGAGRFGGPAQIDIVQKFFAGWLDVLFQQAGSALALSQILVLAEQHFMQVGIEASISQIFYSDGQDSVAERAYIYNNQTYKIVGDPVFVLNADGTREILNIATAPLDENFDFLGGLSSLPANVYLSPRIDPWQIGKAVELEYRGNDLIHAQYTQADFEAETQYLSDSFQPLGGPMEAYFSSLTNNLFNSDITKFLDADGRAIIYGESISTPTDVNTTSGVDFGTVGDYLFVDARRGCRLCWEQG